MGIEWRWAALLSNLISASSLRAVGNSGGPGSGVRGPGLGTLGSGIWDLGCGMWGLGSGVWGLCGPGVVK